MPQEEGSGRSRDRKTVGRGQAHPVADFAEVGRLASHLVQVFQGDLFQRQDHDRAIEGSFTGQGRHGLVSQGFDTVEEFGERRAAHGVQVLHQGAAMGHQTAHASGRVLLGEGTALVNEAFEDGQLLENTVVGRQQAAEETVPAPQALRGVRGGLHHGLSPLFRLERKCRSSVHVSAPVSCV